MFKQITDNWWLLALRGALAVLFGVLAFVWPGVTLTTLVLLFGFYAVFDGVLALYHAVAGGTQSRWVFALEGLVGVLAGIGTLVYPQITALVLLYFIAAWAVLTGAFELAAAIQLRKVIDSGWLLALGGVASIVFGVLLVAQPAAGLLTVVWLIGAYAVVFGALLIGLAFRVRALGQQPRRPAGTSPVAA